MFGYPMMGVGRLGLLGLLFGLLVRLGLLALLVIGFVWLVRSLTRPAIPVQSNPPAPAAAVEPVAAGSCPSCGRPVQADWSHCPYCGTNLKET